MNQTEKYLSRKKFRKIRNNEIASKEKLIYKQVETFLEKLIRLNYFKNKNHIGIYWPLEGEVDLRALKNSFNLTFALPCSNQKGQLEYRKWTENNFKKDFYGIPAPLYADLVNPKEFALILVPALAIDQNGNRLGYGGGCFDRLRENKIWQNIPTFVVLPKACISTSPLPLDPWDIPYKGWITENGECKNKTG
tara:strand:- start:572 stop:1150 length:579 start_codon:yes stop_codon:yes gene_type:complete